MKTINPMHLLRPYFCCFAAGLFSFYNLLQFALFNTFSKNLLSAFHLHSTALGLISSVYLLANAIWLIPGGALLDTFPARKIGLTFLGFAVCGNFVIAFSHSLSVLVFARFFQGLGSAMSLLLSTRLATVCFPKRTGLAVGAIITFALSGGLVGNTIFGYLSLIVGWKMMLFLDGLLGTLIFLMMFGFLHEISVLPKKSFKNNFTFALQSLKKTTINTKIISIGCYIGLMNLPIFIFASLWGNLYLEQVYGTTYAEAVTISGLLFLGIMIGSPLCGGISDWLKSRELLQFYGTLGALISLMILLCSHALSIMELKILFLMWGIFSSVQIIGYASISDQYNLKTRSTATGIASFLENIIGALGQFLFGVLLALTWKGTEFHNIPLYSRDNYFIGLMLFLCAYIFCLAICFRQKSKSISKNNLEVIS